jgi:hypothetical protein
MRSVSKIENPINNFGVDRNKINHIHKQFSVKLNVEYIKK